MGKKKIVIPSKSSSPEESRQLKGSEEEGDEYQGEGDSEEQGEGDENLESGSDQEDSEDEAENERIKKEKTDLKKEALMIFSYFFFVCIYCIVMYFAHGDQDHYFNLHSMSMELTQRTFDFGNGEKPFTEVSDRQDMYLYLRGPLLKFLLAKEYATSETILGEESSENFIPLLAGEQFTPNFYNKLIGGIRIRQTRMKKVSCSLDKPFQDLPNLACFDKYDNSDPDYFQSDQFRRQMMSGRGDNGPYLPEAYIEKQSNIDWEKLQEMEAEQDQEAGSKDDASDLEGDAAVDTVVPKKKISNYLDAVLNDFNISDTIEEKKMKLRAKIVEGLETWWNKTLDYKSPAETKDFPFSGLAYTYDADGFVADLPTDIDKAEAMLRILEQRQWVCAGTRAVVVRFWTYNPVLTIVYAGTVLFEMPSGGGVIPRIDQHAIKIDRYSGDRGNYQIGLELFFYIFLLGFVGIEFYEMKVDGIKTYCADGWNLFDWVNLLLFFSTGIVRVFVHRSILQLPVESGNEYIEISAIITLVKIEDYCNAVSLFFLLIKLFRLLGKRFPRVNLFGRLIQAASLDLLLLISLLVLFVFVFAFAGYVAFSSSNYEFRSLSVAMLTAIRGVFGDLDFEQMYIGFGSQMAFSAFFFFGFQMVILLVMINVFIAVVNESWETVQQNDEKQSLSDLYKRLLGQKTKINKDEFFNAFVKVDPNVSHARADYVFECLDHDSSGFIEEDEMQAIKHYIACAGDDKLFNKKEKKNKGSTEVTAHIQSNNHVQTLLKPQDMQLDSLRQLVNHKLNVILRKLAVAGIIDDSGRDIPIPTITNLQANQATNDDCYDELIPDLDQEQIQHMKEKRMELGFVGGTAGDTNDKEWQETMETRVNSIVDKLEQTQSSSNSIQDGLRDLRSVLEQLDGKVANLPSTISVTASSRSSKSPPRAAVAASTVAKTVGTSSTTLTTPRKTGFWARVKGSGEKYYHSIDGRKIPDGDAAIEAYLADKNAGKSEKKSKSRRRGNNRRRSRRSRDRSPSSSGSYSDSRSSYTESGSMSSSSYSSDYRSRRR